MEKPRDTSSDTIPPGHSRDEDNKESRSSSPIPDATEITGENSAETPDSTVSNEKDYEYLTGFKLVAIMFSLTLVTFLMLLDTSIVSTAIPRITSQFHSLDDVGWYGTAYMLTNCALQPLTGKIYTYFSNKWVFLSFFAVFELGSLLCGAATSSNMLIIGRAVAGLGSSGILNGAYTILNASLPLPKQPKYIGVLLGVSQLGIVGGPLIGGALTQYATWRWCFYINLPCGAVTGIILFLVSIPDHSYEEAKKQTVRSRLSKLDFLGFTIFAPTIIQLLLALQWGGTKYAWGSATVIGLICGAFGTFLVFLTWEHRMGEEAMIPFSIIRRRVIWCSCINYGCFVGCMLTLTYYLPIYFQAVRDASPTSSGVNLLPSIISTIIFGVVGGTLVGRIGYYLPFGVLSGILTAIGSGLITTFTPTTAVGIWIGYQIIVGVGRGTGFQVPIIAAQNNSSKEQVSIVTALVVFSQSFGGVLFLTLAQVIFSDRLRHGLATYAPEVNAEVVIVAGATAVRSVVSAASLPGVLLAYSKSVDAVFYLSTGAAGGAFLSSFGMRWMNIKKGRNQKSNSKQEA